MSNSAFLERQAGDSPFRSDPSLSFTMPARFYTSAEAFELEKEAIFYRT
ncbi:MAG: hypothetical protein ACR2PF_13925 [Rhizobiaceae bacterium]